MATVDLIKSCSLFVELLDKEIDEILETCFVERYEDGEKIIKEGEVGSDFFVILSGRAKVMKHVDGKMVEIVEIQKGEAFGESVLVSEAKRMTDVTASGSCEVLVVGQDTIFSLFEKKPRIFSILILNLARVLSGKLRQSNRAIARIHARYQKVS